MSLIYVPQQGADGLGRSQGIPELGGQLTAQATAQFGQAIGGFGDALAKVSAQQYAITRETNEAKKTTDFMVGVEALNDKYRNDPDPGTAPQRYNEEVTKLREQSLDGFDAQTRAQMELKLQRYSISQVGNQKFDSIKRQSDQYTASLDSQYQILTNRYAAAKTDAERTTISGELDTTLQRGVTNGMTTAKAAEGYRQSLAKSGDEALALRQIGANPAAAVATFADPTKYAGLDPVRRQQLVDHAKAAAEEARAAGIVQEARFNPASAAMKAGRLTDPRQAEAVFDKAIIPQESGGNAGAVSVQGALGVSQVMPNTARMVAGKLGMSNVASMDDATLKQHLTSNPALARQLGLEYFKGNLSTFNGNLAPTIAAYHAGPGGSVAKAHAAAVAAHGDNYTVDQFLAQMPPGLKDGSGKATVDYVRDIYRRMGAPTNVASYSTASSYRLSNAVSHEMDKEIARQNQVMQGLVSVAGRQADELAPILKNGYQPDPAAVAGVRSTLSLATQRGDANAAEKLRSFDEAVSLAPVVQQMYRMKPEHIEGELSSARQQMASGFVSPDVHRRVQLLEKVSGEIATARKDNPIALLERQGISQATPVNVTADLNDAAQLNAFRGQISARALASDKAGQLYGTHQFFRPEEKLAIKQRFDDMGDNDKFRLIKELSDGTGSETAFRAAVTELTGGNGHAATAGMFMRKNPELARSIMAGANYLEQPGVKPKVDDLKKGIAAAFGGDMYPAATQGQLIEATLAVYAAERGKNGALYDPQDTAGLERAVERVIGRVEKINGRRVPVPADLAGWQVRDALDKMTPAALDAMGGAYGVGGAPLDARFVGRNAQLLPAGVADGRFAVVLPGPGGQPRPVMTKDNQPLVVDLNALVKGVRLGQAQTPQQARNAAAADYARRGNDGREVLP